jgi:hypothetical protein
MKPRFVIVMLLVLAMAVPVSMLAQQNSKAKTEASAAQARDQLAGTYRLITATSANLATGEITYPLEPVINFGARSEPQAASRSSQAPCINSLF